MTFQNIQQRSLNENLLEPVNLLSINRYCPLVLRLKGGYKTLGKKIRRLRLSGLALGLISLERESPLQQAYKERKGSTEAG